MSELDDFLTPTLTHQRVSSFQGGRFTLPRG
jgi:hypothetical protein